jgi:hypothetical protein
MAREGGVPVVRIAGATLVSYVTWMGCLVGTVAIALLFTELPKGAVFAMLGAGVVYLVVLALRPKRLASWALLAPLFEAGPAGHLVAMLARLPHLAVLVVGNWIAFRFFDIDVPWSDALVYFPILLVATTLPIAPQGFGTRDTVAALFFAHFASGATQAERLGRLAACTLAWGIAQSVVAVLFGLVCARIVGARTGARHRTSPVARESV